MKKNELIDRITREARLRRSEAIRAVKAVVGSIRATISEGGKIAAFISLGVLLLVVSFMYQRLKKLLLADETPVDSTEPKDPL